MPDCGKDKKRESMTEKIYWIKATLTNDETSSDEELIKYFMEEGKMTEKEAKKWVAKRSNYMGKIFPIEEDKMGESMNEDIWCIVKDKKIVGKEIEKPNIEELNDKGFTVSHVVTVRNKTKITTYSALTREEYSKLCMEKYGMVD
jgi:polyhydroxyalkanoate synthesis regulator phasin